MGQSVTCFSPISEVQDNPARMTAQERETSADSISADSKSSSFGRSQASLVCLSCSLIATGLGTNAKCSAISQSWSTHAVLNKQAICLPRRLVPPNLVSPCRHWVDFPSMLTLRPMTGLTCLQRWRFQKVPLGRPGGYTGTLLAQLQSKWAAR